MARRLSWFLLQGLARRVVQVLSVLLGGVAAADTIVEARYVQPTERYSHAILGDAIEWGALELGVDTKAGKTTLVFKLPLERVFEDIEPRLIDVDLDGKPEVVVVETHLEAGAQLAIYDESGKIAATPHIGATHRWLAPIGGADLDGDGFIELAYIDRPHLAKTLRIWRFKNGELEHVADQPGLTNHHIGDSHIGGGLRLCEGKLDIITASANWRRIVATQIENGAFYLRDIGPYTGRASLDAAMICK